MASCGMVGSFLRKVLSSTKFDRWVDVIISDKFIIRDREFQPQSSWNLNLVSTITKADLKVEELFKHCGYQ